MAHIHNKVHEHTADNCFRYIPCFDFFQILEKKRTKKQLDKTNGEQSECRKETKSKNLSGSQRDGMGWDSREREGL